MNRTITASLVALGMGVAAYQVNQRSDIMSPKNIKKMRKKVAKMLY
ncbi:YrzQ family protein [Cytobacillus sp. IB215665]|nr:YrzQ family protein [Cytobacillus sp. IB215665]MDX8364107.1 YrzQ family protein [Cytobacillus sp. IB215665]